MQHGVECGIIFFSGLAPKGLSVEFELKLDGKLR